MSFFFKVTLTCTALVNQPVVQSTRKAGRQTNKSSACTPSYDLKAGVHQTAEVEFIQKDSTKHSCVSQGPTNTSTTHPAHIQSTYTPIRNTVFALATYVHVYVADRLLLMATQCLSKHYINDRQEWDIVQWEEWDTV